MHNLALRREVLCYDILELKTQKEVMLGIIILYPPKRKLKNTYWRWTMIGKILRTATTIACLTLLIGCTQGVSKEQYDRVANELSQVTSQLNQAKQELEETQKELAAAKEATQAPGELRDTTQSFEPKVQLMLLLLENYRDYNLWKAGKILESEYFLRATNIWSKIENTLKTIGDEQFKQKFTKAWFEPSGSKDKARLWEEIYGNYFIPWFTELRDKLKQLSTAELGK